MFIDSAPVPPKLDPSDLVGAAEVSRMLGLSHATSVTTYLRRYEDFPRPVPSADIGAYEVVSLWSMFSAHGHPLALARIETTGPNPQMEMEGDFSPRIAFTKKAIRPEGLRTILEGSRAVFECFRPEIEGD